MNRRDFLLIRKSRRSDTAELSCEQLYMRYVDSTLDGTTAQLFKNVQESLSAVNVLRLKDSSWLECEELSPMKSLIAAFRLRGGHVEAVGNQMGK